MRKTAVLIALMVLAFTTKAGDRTLTQLSSKELLDKMISAMDNVKTMRYRLKKEERIENRLVPSENTVKLQIAPHKIYLYSVLPNPGAEVLWIKGENNDEVLVNPNKFPFINLNLSPYNSLLRHEQHHTILDLGFNFMSSVLKNSIAKFGQKFYDHAIYDGDVIWNNVKYYRLTIDNDNFSYSNYVVKKNENLTKIAAKFFLNDYKILIANPKIKNYDDVKEGQTILLPNAYGKKIVFYIDKVNFLPLFQIIYDEKGIYEKYEIYNLTLNTPIPQIEFTPKFKEYHF